MTYALVCNNKVIEILYNQSEKPIWPPDPEGNLVEAIECDETVERGMTYNSSTNNFNFISIEETIKELSQLDRIERLLNTSINVYRQEGADRLTLSLIETGIL